VKGRKLERHSAERSFTEFHVHDVLDIFQVTGRDKHGRQFMAAGPAKKGDFLQSFVEQPLLTAPSTTPGGDL